MPSLKYVRIHVDPFESNKQRNRQTLIIIFQTQTQHPSPPPVYAKSKSTLFSNTTMAPSTTTFAVPQQDYNTLVSFLYDHDYNVQMRTSQARGSRHIMLTVADRDVDTILDVARAVGVSIFQSDRGE
ncbi:hypothetical protein DFH27DRAFT_648309 [Peziza echinospora]|nr:hypothetical protein DFH27DRAFT_648309 [Peziza echinospora]